MAKTKLLPEFPTEWHQQAYLEGLEREVAGRLNRLAELKALAGAEPELLKQTEGELEAARAELLRVAGHGQKAAAKRPARPVEERAGPRADKK